MYSFLLGGKANTTATGHEGGCRGVSHKPFRDQDLLDAIHLALERIGAANKRLGLQHCASVSNR